MNSNRQICIITDDGTKLIPFQPEMLLEDLKRLIEKNYNYIKETYFLKYNGKPMYENKKLIEYNIKYDESIHVVIRASSFMYNL